MREHGFRPWELNQLTMTETAVLLLAHKQEEQVNLERGQSAMSIKAIEEAHRKKYEANQRYQALPLAERLKQAKARYPW